MLEITYKENNILETVKKKRLRWALHARKSQNSLLRTVLVQNPIGKRPLGRLKMRLEDVVMKDIVSLGGEPNWKLLAMDRDNWTIGCEMGWS